MTQRQDDSQRIREYIRALTISLKEWERSGNRCHRDTLRQRAGELTRVIGEALDHSECEGRDLAVTYFNAGWRVRLSFEDDPYWFSLVHPDGHQLGVSPRFYSEGFALTPEPPHEDLDRPEVVEYLVELTQAETTG